MRKFLLILAGALLAKAGSAQAVFQSAATGNWDSPSSWTLVSGTSTAGYPVAGDTATITGNAITVDANLQCSLLTVNGSGTLEFNSTSAILTVTNGMTIAANSIVDLNLGLLTVTGNATIGGGATVTINQGALTVVGLLALNSPTSAGTTLLDVEGGAFSCVGGMTVTATTVPAGRFAELRINNGAVNLAGGLITVTANAKIDFSGPGTMTLAGLISIGNTASWIPGTGRVVYFGIPGSNQTVAPLNYYRLVITGLGTGLKQINGAVTVADSLTLLTDTLVINSGGSLTLGDGITIVRTGGQLISPPIFAGAANLLYNDIARDTTGDEMPPTPGILQDLTISDFSGIVLATDVTVATNLHCQQGALITGSHTLSLTNAAGGAGIDPGITPGNGYILGKLVRTIGNSTGLRIFPMGVDNGDNRELDIDFTTAPTTAGTLTVWAVDSSAPAQSGLPLTDNGVTIWNVASAYWEADAANGLSGGQYTLTLTGEGIPEVYDVNTLRILKRPSSGGAWVLDGVDGTHSGTPAIPVVSRTGLTGFSQFSFGSDASNPLPVTLLSFTGSSAGNRVFLSWSTTSEANNTLFTIEHSGNGWDFQPLGSVPGAGSTNTKQNYTFTHDDAPAGPNFYRLKQTDANGAYTYSPIIVCTVVGNGVLLMYPNPANSILTIAGISGQGKPYIISPAGRTLGPLNAGANDISKLAPGCYYIRYGSQVLLLVKQ